MRAWFVFLLAACGDPSAAPPADATPPADAGPDSACEAVLGEPELDLELIVGGLEKPSAVVSPPGDPRLFVLEQKRGVVRIVEDGVLLPEPFLTIDENMGGHMEQGLLSLAFHPDYAGNRRFFVSHTRAGDNALIVEEWTTFRDDPGRAEGVAKRLFELPQPDLFHHSGRIGFGPDGYLYLGRGDGGPQFDPLGHTQDLSLLYGKFLRVDVDHEDPGLPYAIPADNPFVGMAGVRPEIYAVGVRNPWGWSIDPATGHLYFGDVSLNTREEISVIPADQAGGNYGWPVLAGDRCMEAGCDPSPFVAPLYTYEWATLEYCAAIGGHVYRGCRMPGHHGRYFFSDFCASFLRSFRWSALDDAPVQVTEHAGVSGLLYNVSSLGVDRDGELLLVDWEEGELYRVVPATP